MASSDYDRDHIYRVIQDALEPNDQIYCLIIEPDEDNSWLEIGSVEGDWVYELAHIP